MPKHTPGPWYTLTKPDAAQGLIYRESTGANIAVSYSPNDAHLIAAAPSLLTACQYALNFLDTEKEIVGYGHKTAELLRTAIAKAEGE